MSPDNVAIVRHFTQLFEAGDRDGWREYFDPDVVWDASASGLPMAGVYHGHEGVVRFFGSWLAAWTDYEIETDEILDAGDAVVVVFRQAGTGRGSGIRAEREFFNVYELRDSKVVRCRLCESREQALEAAGLST